MKKKKIITVVIVLLIILLLGGGIFYFMKKEEDAKKNEPVKFQIEKKLLKVCKLEQCPTSNEDIYHNISLDTDIPEVQKVLNEINQTTASYYKKSLNSHTEDVSCAAVKDMYSHSYRTSMSPILYAKGELIGISVIRFEKNICTNEFEYIPFVTYTYDRKKERMLSQEELYKKMKLKEKNIAYAIEEDLKEKNRMNQTNYTLEDTYQNGKLSYTLFFQYNGDLLAMYHLNPMNQDASVIVKPNNQKLVD